MPKPKLVIVISNNKVPSIYVSPELKGRVEVFTIDYDKHGEELDERGRMGEILIEENIVVQL